METTFGVLVHSGGVIAESPPVTVTLVQAVARLTGLDLELIAELPADQRSSLRRQSHPRTWAAGVTPAPRVLLPPADEGLNLRVGWLDDDDRAQWVYPWSGHSSSGTGRGREYLGRFTIPLRSSPLRGITIALAWPEIGFPERTFEVRSPDRAELERVCRSIWDAPVAVGMPPPQGLARQHSNWPTPGRGGSIGRIVAEPTVLLRTSAAVVALTRLSEQGELISAEITSEANGSVAAEIRAAVFPRSRPDQDVSRRPDPRVVIGVALDGVIHTCPPKESNGTGGDDLIRQVSTYLLPRPDGDDLRLIVAWPMADLAETLITIPIGSVGTT